MHHEHKNTKTQNKMKHLKPRFGRLLWPPAWKWSESILKRNGK